MCDEIIKNLTQASEAMIFFFVAYCANILFSLYYNIGLVNEKFDSKRLIKGLIKAFIFIVGLVMLIVSITGLPIFMNAIGLVFPDEYVEVFSNIVIISVITSVTIKYVLESFIKFKNILGYSDESSTDTEE